MDANVFLLANLALAFYLAGTIWAHELDIFRTWALIDTQDFHRVQTAHWRRLPYWIFTPLALALAGSIGLIWLHPPGSPSWAIWGNVGLQLTSHLLTVFLWGRWQGMLSQDDRGSASPYLKKILATHWIRTLLISAYALTLLGWTIVLFA